MSGSEALDRGRVESVRQRFARGAWISLLGAGAWLVSTAVGCAENHDPLTERCLEALAYHSPAHGRVQEIQRGLSPDGWTVSVLHRAESGAADGDHRFSCEYEIGNRWRFLKIAVEDRELRESELALVNAELFLRDLARGTGRFGEPQGPADVSAAPPRRT